MAEDQTRGTDDSKESDDSMGTDGGGRFEWADRETLLDVSVNVVPLVILLFFIGYYLIMGQWGDDPVIFVLTHFLTIMPFVMLALVTYVSAKVISRDEQRA